MTTDTKYRAAYEAGPLGQAVARLRATLGPPGAVLACVGIAALLTFLALHQLLYAGALLYLAVFWIVSWRQPGIALMLILAAAPFQNDLSGGGGAKFSIAEVNLMLTLPVFYGFCLVRKQLPKVGPILLPVMLYFMVCLCSSLLHWQGGDAIISLVQMFLYFIVAVAVFCSFAVRSEQMMPAFYVLVGVGVFLAIMGLITNYWFIGLNKNGIAASLASAFLVGTDLCLAARAKPKRFWLLAALAVIGVGLLMSLSRGAWMGTLCGVVFIFLLRREYKLLGRVALAMLPLLAIFWIALPPEAKDYAMGFGAEHYNIKLRYDSLDIACGYFNQSPLYGMGVGLRKNYDATNVLMMTLAETGVLGLAAFLLIHISFYRMIWKAQAWIVPSETLYTFLCIGGALVLDKFVHGLVDHYWSRGAIMAAWGSAGMAARAYFIAQGRASLAHAGIAPQPDALVEDAALGRRLI